jgi:NADH:ubiquinone oxidoreductase subunit F (NADH-binding)
MEESCGSCAPCRILTGIYKKTIEKIINGKATKKDVENLLKWSSFMKNNRCGLGQTAMNPTVTTIKNFRELYDKKVKDNGDFVTEFDEKTAIIDYENAVKIK